MYMFSEYCVSVFCIYCCGTIIHYFILLSYFFIYIYIYIYIVFYFDVFQLYEIMRINYSFELDPRKESMLSRWSLMWDPLRIIDLLRKW